MQVISKVIQLKKYPRPYNLKRGNFCVYQEEVDAVGPNDTVVVSVFNSSGNLVAQTTYSSEQFHGGLNPWTKTDEDGSITAAGYYLAF